MDRPWDNNNHNNRLGRAVGLILLLIIIVVTILHKGCDLMPKKDSTNYDAYRAYNDSLLAEVRDMKESVEQLKESLDERQAIIDSMSNVIAISGGSVKEIIREYHTIPNTDQSVAIKLQQCDSMAAACDKFVDDCLRNDSIRNVQDAEYVKTIDTQDSIIVTQDTLISRQSIMVDSQQQEISRLRSKNRNLKIGVGIMAVITATVAILK